MKKTFSFISVFILLVTMFSGFFMFDNKNTESVKAADTTIAKYSKGDYGTLTVYQGGKITIKYKYGFTELLIYFQKCTNYAKDGTCDGYDTNGYVTHISGEKNLDYDPKDNSKDKTKTVHIFNNPNVQVDDLIKVYIYIDFIDTATGITTNTSKFKPLYCNYDAKIDNCEKGNLITNRIKNIGKQVIASNYETDGLVYTGNGENNDAKELTPSTYTYIEVKVDNTPFTDTYGSGDGAIEQTTKTIKTVLLIVLGLAAGVTTVVLGVQIVKNADESGERSEAINRLRSILIGLIIVAVLVLIWEYIYEFMKSFIE